MTLSLEGWLKKASSLLSISLCMSKLNMITIRLSEGFCCVVFVCLFVVCLYCPVFGCLHLHFCVLLEFFYTLCHFLEMCVCALFCSGFVCLSLICSVVTAQLLLSLPSTPLDRTHGCPFFYGDSPQLLHGKTTSPVRSSKVPEPVWTLLDIDGQWAP